MDTLTRLLVISIVGCVEAGGVRREYAGEPLVFAAVPLHAPVPVLRVLSATPLRARSPRPDLEPQETAPVPRYKPAAARGVTAGKQRLRPSSSAYRDIDYEENYEYTRLAPPAGTGSYGYTRLAPAAPSAPSYEDEYEVYAPQPAYSTSHVYSTSLAQPSYDTVHASSAEPLLYARPLPSGGYTYRRATPKVPAAAPLAPPPRPAKEPPYIIKIHKYRIVKDRRRR